MNRSERIYALSSLWAAAREVYPYFDRLDIDWDEAYRRYLPRLTDETDDLQAWLGLAEFLRLLDDGHTSVVLPRALVESYGFFRTASASSATAFSSRRRRGNPSCCARRSGSTGSPWGSWSPVWIAGK